MKTRLLFSAIAVMSVIACSKNNPDVQNDASGLYDGPVTIVKVSSDPTYKTHFGVKEGNKYPVCWSSGDAINVNGIASTSIAINPSNPSSADFTFPSELDFPYSAVYPASVVTSFDKGTGADTLCCTLPSIQNYTEGSFDPAAGVMLGWTSDENLCLRNAMAYLKLNISGGSLNNAIKSVRVRSNFDILDNSGHEAMSGDFKAVLSADTLYMAQVIGDCQSVTLNCGESGVAQGTDLIIAIPAQTYSKGINLFIVDVAGNCQEIISENAFAAKAGGLYPTSISFDGGIAYTGIGLYTANDWNAFSIQTSELGYCTEFEDESGVVNVRADITADNLRRVGGANAGVFNATFAGKFNGNGHTITAKANTVPFFTYISGEVRNVTFAGNKTAFGTWGTVQVALDLYEGAVIDSVVTDFKVTAVPTEDAVTNYYGMFRNIKAGATVSNCVQKSDFTIDYNIGATKDLYVLPFAYNNSGSVYSCSNEGDVTFVQDPGQKVVVANIYQNSALLDGFVNTGNFRVISSMGGAVAGLVVEGGGFIRNCVNGALESEQPAPDKGVISVNSESASGKSYHVAGISAYGDRGSANCGRYYGCVNYGTVSLEKTTAVSIYRSAVAGILSDIRYGAYDSEKTTTFDNVYNTLDGCINKGYVKFYEPACASTSGTCVPVCVGGILGMCMNVNGTSGGAFVFTKTTSQMNGNYMVMRTNCANYGTLELASASVSPVTASITGARLNYVGGLAGFTYGFGNSATTGSNAHYAVIRGTQNGVIKLGSSVEGCIAAGGLVGGCCYTKCEQANVENVTYEATGLLTNGKAASYRGAIAGTIGLVVKYSDVTTVVNANLTDNTGLKCSSSLDNTSMKGYAGVTGAKSVHRTSTTETPKITVKTGSLYNGVAVAVDDIYGNGNKAVQ